MQANTITNHDPVKDIQSPTKKPSAQDDLTDSPMSFGKVDCQVRASSGIRPFPGHIEPETSPHENEDPIQALEVSEEDQDIDWLMDITRENRLKRRREKSMSGESQDPDSDHSDFTLTGTNRSLDSSMVAKSEQEMRL